MGFIDIDALPVVEPRPGWRGQFFHSANMTFACYALSPGAAVHEHWHPQEEVWYVVDGELDVALDGCSKRVSAGHAVVVTGGQRHAVRAVKPSRVVVVDHPVRTSVGGIDTGAPAADSGDGV